MTTFLDLKTDVANIIIDTPASVIAAIPTIINQSIRSLQNAHNFRAMEDVLTFTTVEGVGPIGTSNVFKEYRDYGPYLNQQYSKARRLFTNSNSNVRYAEVLHVDRLGSPKYVRNSKNAVTDTVAFFVAPFPDTNSDWDDGNYIITIPMYAYTAALTADAESHWFTNNAAEYITYKSAAEGFARDHDYEAMALWLQRADEKKRELIRADKLSRVSSVSELVPQYNGVLTPPMRD